MLLDLQKEELAVSLITMHFPLLQVSSLKNIKHWKTTATATLHCMTSPSVTRQLLLVRFGIT